MGSGYARCGRVREKTLVARFGGARPGKDVLGVMWSGKARRGTARRGRPGIYLGIIRYSGRGEAVFGKAAPGRVWLGTPVLVVFGQGLEKCIVARHGMMRRGLAGSGKDGQFAVWQGGDRFAAARRRAGYRFIASPSTHTSGSLLKSRGGSVASGLAYLP